jgi:hypothetical protein
MSIATSLKTAEEIFSQLNYMNTKYKIDGKRKELTYEKEIPTDKEKVFNKIVLKLSLGKKDVTNFIECSICNEAYNKTVSINFSSGKENIIYEIKKFMESCYG